MLIQGNSLKIPLADESVHCVITSPPYYNLRDYGTARWEGGDSECDHKMPFVPRNKRIKQDCKLHDTSDDALNARQPVYKDTCGKCGAKRVDSQIGLEQSPEQYVQNIVEIFREVWRVLRPEGTAFLNLGDSYAGSNNGSSDHRPQGASLSRNDGKYGKHKPGAAGLKPKDLIGIPWRVAFALQADGWWLRQDIIWSKANPMPESVKDRCTKSHEYVFMLTKSERYYYDHRAILEPASYDGRLDTFMKGSPKYKGGFVPDEPEQTVHARGHERWPMKMPPIGGTKHSSGNISTRASGNQPEYRKIRGMKTKGLSDGTLAGNAQHHGNDIAYSKLEKSWSTGDGHKNLLNQDGSLRIEVDEAGIPARNKRSVWQIVAEPSNWDYCKHCDTLYVRSERRRIKKTTVDGKRVRTCPKCGGTDGWVDHYASFPQKLVEPCILAGTSAIGACPKCGAPWERITESRGKLKMGWGTQTKIPTESGGHDGLRTKMVNQFETIGWQPTCNCDAGEPAPCTVLDIFNGTAQTGIAAERYNRRYVGIDINANYLRASKKRMNGTQKQLGIGGL